MRGRDFGSNRARDFFALSVTKRRYPQVAESRAVTGDDLADFHPRKLSGRGVPLPDIIMSFPTLKSDRAR